MIAFVAFCFVCARRLLELLFALTMLALLLVGTIVAAPFLIAANIRAERKSVRRVTPEITR